jgi:hypothetical protein
MQGRAGGDNNERERLGCWAVKYRNMSRGRYSGEGSTGSKALW